MNTGSATRIVEGIANTFLAHRLALLCRDERQIPDRPCFKRPAQDLQNWNRHARARLFSVETNHPALDVLLSELRSITTTQTRVTVATRRFCSDNRDQL